MRKKEIEGIPFLGLPRVKRGKQVEYVAVTDVKEVGKEPCLFVEVYRNRKDTKKVPAVRIALTQKDFGSYFPEAGTWSSGKVKLEGWSDSVLIWCAGEGEVRKSEGIMMKENVLQSPEDLERIKGFLEDVHVWGKDPPSAAGAGHRRPRPMLPVVQAVLPVEHDILRILQDRRGPERRGDC